LIPSLARANGSTTEDTEDTEETLHSAQALNDLGDVVFLKEAYCCDAGGSGL
jgi:hypothetical protein